MRVKWPPLVHNLWAALLRLELRYKLTLALVSLCVLWVASGKFTGHKGLEDAFLGARELSSVLYVEKLHAEDTEVSKTFTARIHALQFVDVLSEVAGKVEEVVVASGNRVESGQVILRVEKREKVERLEQAKALLKERQLEREASASLSSTGYRSEVQDSASLVALMDAATALKSAQLDLDNTQIKVPFSGIVDRIVPQVGSVVGIGQLVAQVANFDQLKVVVMVSEKYVSKLKLAGVVEVLLDGGVVLLHGRISFVSKVASPMTGVYRVEVSVNDSKGVFVTEGMVAKVKLPIGRVKAHGIAASSLSVDDTNALGVKVVGDDGVVKFFKVEICGGDTSGQVWVSGLPDDINLIVRGHEYARVGEKVNGYSVAQGPGN